MAHLGVINLPELLEQILYFLVVDKTLLPYPSGAVELGEVSIRVA